MISFYGILNYIKRWHPTFSFFPTNFFLFLLVILVNVANRNFVSRRKAQKNRKSKEITKMKNKYLAGGIGGSLENLPAKLLVNDLDLSSSFVDDTLSSKIRNSSSCTVSLLFFVFSLFFLVRTMLWVCFGRVGVMRFWKE